MATANPEELEPGAGADWQRRVVGRSLRTAAERSVNRGRTLIRAAATVLERSGGEDITVQEVADEAGQSCGRCTSTSRARTTCCWRCSKRRCAPTRS